MVKDSHTLTALPVADTDDEMEIDLLDLAYVLLDKIHYIKIGRASCRERV